MNAEKFTKKYIGREIRLIKNETVYVKNNTVYTTLGMIIGKCVGYNNDRVVIEANDEAIAAYPSILRPFANLAQHALYYSTSSIEVVNQVSAINPYPHICKLCHSPSRRCDSYILCSNNYCKSRNKLRKLINKYPKIVLGQSKQHPIVLECPYSDMHNIDLSNHGYGYCTRCDARCPIKIKEGIWYRPGRNCLYIWQYTKQNGWYTEYKL